MPDGSGCGSELLLDLGGLVLRGVISMLACIVRQRLDDRNGVAALEGVVILLAAGCQKVFFRGYF
jgi:hypothetical protein